MKWLAALLAALAVIQAGVGVCASPAHAAGPDAMADHAVADQSDQACHETARAHHGVNRHAGASYAPSPHDVAATAHGDHHGEASMDCCEAGGCADCALVTGVLGGGAAADPSMAPLITTMRAPEAPLGRLLSHDPPPPRA